MGGCLLGCVLSPSPRVASPAVALLWSRYSTISPRVDDVGAAHRSKATIKQSVVGWLAAINNLNTSRTEFANYNMLKPAIYRREECNDGRALAGRSSRRASISYR